MAELNFVYFYATKSASQPEMRALCHKRLNDVSKLKKKILISFYDKTSEI